MLQDGVEPNDMTLTAVVAALSEEGVKEPGFPNLRLLHKV